MRWRWSPPVLTTLGVTAAVLGPFFVTGGIALRGDMVFVPDQPWKAAWLGLDGSVPRAVPMDALVSLVDEVVPGFLLQRALLVAAFLVGGLGIARLTRPFRTPAGVAAVIVYLWNPWVFERLAIGQWATVLGYGMLPWLVLAAARWRAGERRAWSATLSLLILTAVCAPSMGLVGAAVAVAVVGTGLRPRQMLAVLGTAVLANLPWLLPGVLGPDIQGDREQFGAFAAHGESSLGTLASLLSMGGIWKSSIVPPERTHVVVVGVAALLALAFVLGFWFAVPVLGRRTAVAVGATGAAALLLALLPAIAPVGRALGSSSVDWPALGILRDSHRYLAPLGLVLAVGAAALVDRLLSGPRDGRGAVAWLLVVAPVLLLPSMVWGLAGDLRPVEYPSDWSRVAAKVADRDGAVVVLPWTGSYRGYAWNDRRAMLDPAARFLPGDVLVDDRIYLRERVLPGEDPFLTSVGDALTAPDPAGDLGRLGVRWVLVEKDNGVPAAQVPAGTVAFDGRWLTLVDLGPSRGDLGHLRPRPPRGIVQSGDLAVLLAACISIWQLARRPFPTRRYRTVRSDTRVLGRGHHGRE